MSCITSSSFYVLVNSKSSKLFGDYRGLHQVDPISPYLFILMAKVLEIFLKSHVRQKFIYGWNSGDKVASHSHL